MALARGTNCDFVLSAPTSDPGAGDYAVIDTTSQALKCNACPAGAVKVIEIGWYCGNATEAADTEVGLYDDTPGLPDNLLGSATFAKGTTQGWKKQTVDINVTPGNIYWIAAQCDDTATATESDMTPDGGAVESYRAAQTALANPWVSDGTVGRLYAFYALYTTAAATGTMNMKGYW